MATPHWAILMVATLHQTLLAGVLVAAIWLAAGRNRWIAVIGVISTMLVWGPNLGAACEMYFYGENTRAIAIADWIGIRSWLDAFYGWTSNTLGYEFQLPTP